LIMSVSNHLRNQVDLMLFRVKLESIVFMTLLI
jgi:hypothetical protein